MLPDYPVAKQKLSRLLNRRMQIRQMHPVFEGKGIRTAHEGDRLSTTDTDGHVDVTPFARVEAEMTVRVDEYDSMTMEDLIKRLDETADDLGRQKSRHMYDMLDRVTEATGNVYDAQGNLTPEKMIDALSRFPWSFDGAGEPQLALLIHPRALPKLRQIERCIDTDPSLSQKWRELLAAKRREWHDREALRKLVG